ncbi:hypothetical protein P1J78_20890 [Psychromarinibacter sp. C21-152]|uniref:Uncharacterized protein n=1 Tax=Psychromarinibacter sediminicola TaxID=3033385 RepID=A0AAE3TBP8_9RHOB|nr:hypothetical protein [Psychromarinibacter sediminicola]MDF0603204.1 hypothetical protein [Psychromarinibacter sediminicola]
MDTTILRLLRDEACAWWANTTPKHIRDSVRRDLATVRDLLRTPGAYIHCGRGGTSLHGENTTISWPGPFEAWGTAVALRKLGLPFIDTRTVPDPFTLVRLPLCCPGRVDPDPEPETPLSYVNLDRFIELNRQLGATIHQ